MVNAETFDELRPRGHRHIADAYLLAPAVANDGELVTFDSAITVTSSVVHGATPDHVLVL